MNTIVYGIRQRTAGLGLDERLAGNLKGAAWLVIIASVIGLAILAFGSPFIIRLAAAAYINLIAVVGLQIFMGNANVVNIGHAGFMALGAYFTAVFATPVMIKATLIPNAPFGLAGVEVAAIYAFILSIAITTLIGLITGLVLVRLAGIAATCQILFVGKLIRRYGEPSLLRIGLPCVAVCLLAWGLLQRRWEFYIVIMGMAIWASILNVSLRSRLTKLTDADETGKLLGYQTSIESAARVLGPLTGAALMEWGSPGLPGLVAGSLLLLSLPLLSRSWRLAPKD